MMGGKRRGSVVPPPPPPPTSTANDGGRGGGGGGVVVAGGKCGEAESALPPLLESPTEKVEQLQKTPAKAGSNGDDAGEGDDDEEEDENEEEESEKENEDVVDGEVGDGEEETAEKTKLAEGFYLIEAVRKKRIRKGETQYFIKWRDWPESANTWEPLENLRMSVPDVIATFEESLLSRSRRKRKRRNGSLSQTRKKQQKRTPINVSAEKLNPRVNNETVITENGVDVDPSRIEGIEIEDDDNDDVIETSENLEEHVEQDAELTGQNAVANGSDKTESVEGLEKARSIGARKRKSGCVRRFKAKSNSGCVDDLEKAAANGVRSENLEKPRDDDVGFNIRRNICTITEIIKVTNFTSCMTGNTTNVCVTFLVKRSDGKEMTVDNKFLKSHFPDLLLDFYEQRLWCKV